MRREDIEKDENKPVMVPVYTKYRDIPEWYWMLAGCLGQISGCFVGKVRSEFIVSGMPRDIENFAYLLAFLGTEIDHKSEQYRKELPKPKHRTESARRAAVRDRIGAFRKGMVSGIHANLRAGIASFFSNPTSGKDLVTVDERYENAKSAMAMKIKQHDVAEVKKKTNTPCAALPPGRTYKYKRA